MERRDSAGGIGVKFVDNPGALALWKDAGADVQGERVRIPRGLARKLCATAPRQYTQHARNPERNVVVGGKNLVLAPVYGPPFIRTADEGRRYATIADFRNFVKLATCRNGCTIRRHGLRNLPMWR